MSIYISELTTSTDTMKYDEAKELLESIGFDVVPQVTDEYKHLIRRIDKMLSCNYIYMLDGWSSCKESRIEYAIAKELSIPILYETYFIPTCSKITMVQNAIHEVTGLTIREYASSRRSRNLFYARMLFVHFCSDLGFKLSQIATFINRDHSTITYVMNKYKDEVKYNRQFKKMAQSIENIINSEKNLQQQAL